MHKEHKKLLEEKELFQKIIKVGASCNTLEQKKVAVKYMRLAYKMDASVATRALALTLEDKLTLEIIAMERQNEE